MKLIQAAGLTALFLTTACAYTPTERTRTTCPACIKTPLNATNKHPLIAYTKNFSDPNKHTLHVYLEGDGLPWYRGAINANPSSKKLTALKLMSIDSRPSLYINRPCYGYDVLPKNCSSKLWVSDRYSEEVIKAMNQGIDEVQRVNNFKKVLLIGHSGGGTIAMLLAGRRKDVYGVITLGANLDHQDWTRHFDSPALSGSLNPAKLPALEQRIFRWHFAGDKDRVVPAALTQKAAEADPFGEFILKRGYDHSCCWQDDWAETLKRSNTAL